MKETIEVSTSRARPNRTVIFSLLLIAGTASMVPGCPAGRPRGGVRILCNLPTAGIYVDGKFVGRHGTLNGRVIRLRKGLHLIEVRNIGYFARYRQVRVGPDGIRTLKIHLHRMLE